MDSGIERKSRGLRMHAFRVLVGWMQEPWGIVRGESAEARPRLTRWRWSEAGSGLVVFERMTYRVKNRPTIGSRVWVNMPVAG
jgi:hypothetical protein